MKPICPNCKKQMSPSGGDLDGSVNFYTCRECKYEIEDVMTIEIGEQNKPPHKPTAMSRKSGYYWVLPQTDEFGWTIGKWYSNIEKWEVIGFTYSHDTDFTEIDPNPIVRENIPTKEMVNSLIDDLDEDNFGTDHETSIGIITTQFSWSKAEATLYQFANKLLGTNYTKDDA